MVQDKLGYFYFYIAFTYNADGIRTSKTVDGVKHEYLLNGSQIMGERWTIEGVKYTLIYLYDENGSPMGLKYRTNAYAANEYDYFFFEKNLQGDIVAVYNASGTKIGGYIYDAWGVCTTSVTSGNTTLENSIVQSYNPFRYRGYYCDTQSGWYYLQSRYYNPYWGRFVNADGYVSTGQGILGNNMFAYCGNNPISRIDSLGSSWKDFLIDLITFGVEAVEAKNDMIEFGEWFWNESLNVDGTHSLYDNKRHNPNSVFHEQILVCDPIGDDVDLTSGAYNIGGSFTFITGGWEFDNVDISLLDFVQVSAGVSVSSTHFEANVGVSAWSPSISFDIFGGSLSIGANLGLEYGLEYGKKYGFDAGVFSISYVPNN